MKFQISNFKFQIHPLADGAAVSKFEIRKSPIGNSRAFSLIEVMIVVSLLSLIVLALMAVFNSTQRAFRASVTQSDVLEGSRAAMDLIASDLRGITPSDGVSNSSVNFCVLGNTNYSAGYVPLTQALPGGSVQRTNLLNYFFLLSRENTKWTGVGYVVDNTNSSSLFPLYRFYAETNLQSNPVYLFDNFFNAVAASQWTNMSRLLDGVVHLTVHAYDNSGTAINNSGLPPYNSALNTYFLPATAFGEAQLYMFSNTVPASVELELGVLEDQVLQHAESLPTTLLQSNYLAGQSGSVHLFRQRVSIPNFDPTAYQ
jgi:prepilin-type N-terminal cleavage/methylation domain-containing protein